MTEAEQRHKFTFVNPLRANLQKLSNDNLPTNGLRVLDQFVGLALKGLIFVLCLYSDFGNSHEECFVK